MIRASMYDPSLFEPGATRNLIHRRAALWSWLGSKILYYISTD